MLSANKLRKINNNKSVRSKTLVNVSNNKENKLAIEEAKKYYQKYYSIPNSALISQLKTKTLNIFLSNYNYNDISVIYGILKKYLYFETIYLAPNDPEKKNVKSTNNKNKREPITEGEKYKKDKEKRDEEVERLNMINKVISGLGKHLSLSKALKTLIINDMNLSDKLALNLSKGIIQNESIEKLTINNCTISLGEYELLLKGFFNHQKIQYLDLSNNKLKDGYGNMIGRIIGRQTYRRDQVIWLLGIRNEKPLTNEYALGLISINLSGNQLSSHSAECITTSLSLDQYIRSIILSNNQFDNDSCKKFVYMLRRNLTLLNVDLRDNPGYDDNIKFRLVTKMSKNIRHLYNQYQKNLYTTNEFENLKGFIDPTFFNLDIPEDIIKLYYDNNGQIIRDNNYTNNNIQSIQNNKIHINNFINNDKEHNKITKKNSNSNKKRRAQSKTNSYKKEKNLIKLSENKNNSNKKLVKNKNYLGSNNNNNNNLIKYKSLSIDKNNNNNLNKLLQENLLLKRKIIEFKAKEVQNKLGKNIIIPDKYDNNNLNNNFSVANELLDKLNNLMISMKIDNKNNSNNNINSQNMKNKQDIIKNNTYNENISNTKIEKSLDSNNEKEGKFNNIDYFDLI